MIYQKDGWTVEVSADPEFRGDHFDVLFHNTVRSGNRCLGFVLFDDDRQQSHNAVLELNIFGGGKVRAWCYSPCMVQVYRREKVVLIGVMHPTTGSMIGDILAAEQRAEALTRKPAR